jgi:DNA-directed RNA polymerase specialized sigma24 family protein
MSNQAQNENFRILDDFVCEANQQFQSPTPTPANHGGNEGAVVLEERVLDLGVAPRPDVDADGSSPISRNALERLSSALNELPGDYRSIILLRLSGLSLAEISERLGISIQASASTCESLVRTLRGPFQAKDD